MEENEFIWPNEWVPPVLLEASELRMGLIRQLLYERGMNPTGSFIQIRNRWKNWKHDHFGPGY